MITNHEKPYDIKNDKIVIEDVDEIEDLGLIRKNSSHAELYQIRKKFKGKYK